MQAPSRTPKILKSLILITIVVALLTPLLGYFLDYFWQMIAPGKLLALSSGGMALHHFWQFLTYPFVYTTGVTISIALLLTLAIHMGLLWFFGRDIAHQIGLKRFCVLYAGAALFGGILSAGILTALGLPFLVFGSMPIITAFIALWVLLYPDLTLTFFLLFRFRAHTALLILIGLILLSDLITLQWASFIASLGGALFGLAFGRLVLKRPVSVKTSPPKKRKKNHDNIIDITDFSETDDAFMDRMLSKISREGESSLTSREKERMKKISNKKRSTPSH